MPLELWLIAVLSALGLAIIDIYDVQERWISPIYLADAVLELLFVLLWLALLPQLRRGPGW